MNWYNSTPTPTVAGVPTSSPATEAAVSLSGNLVSPPATPTPTPTLTPTPTPKPSARYTPQQVVERYYALIINAATRSDARELIKPRLQEQQGISDANTGSFWENIQDVDVDVRNTKFESDTSVRVSTFIRYFPYGKDPVCEIRELTVSRDEETNQWLINDPGDSNAQSQYDPIANCN